MNLVHILRVVWFTFFQAACSTLMALLIGLPAGFFCGRRRFAGRKFLLSLSVIPFCVPSLIIALGYVTFLGLNGGLNQLLMFLFGLKNPPVKILYSFAGLVIAHGFYNFPLIMKNTADAWEKLPREPAECARLLGAGEGRIFRTVTLYQLLPSIASSSMLVFIYCFLSFILVLLFGGIGNSTLEVEIYKAARATLDFKTAGILAVLETAILCIVVTLYTLLENKAARVKGLECGEKNQLLKIKGARETVPFVILIVVIVLFFICPLGGIIFNAFSSVKKGQIFTLKHFALILKMRSFWPSVRTTFVTGICTAVLCTVVAFVYAVFLRFREGRNSKNKNAVLKIIPMLPMCISSVVTGVAVTLIFHRGNGFILVLCQTALNWPLALRIIYSQLSKVSDETLDCAAILSKNKMDTVFRILIPLCSKSLLSAFGFCFAVSAGDTTLPLVLAIPKFDTLSLFTYRLAGAYRFNEACAAGVILGLICAVVFAIAKDSEKSEKGKK